MTHTRTPTESSRSPIQHRSGGRFRAKTIGAAATGLAVSGIAEPASAAIIYDLAANVSTGGSFQANGTGTTSIDVVSRGMMFPDLLLEVPSGMMGAETSTVQLSVIDSGGINYLNVLSAGDTLDSGSSTFASEAYLLSGGVSHPTWAEGQINYAGFSFEEAGSTFYGWLQVQYTSGTDFTVLQWAYSTDPNVGIEIGAIPEPSTALLLGVGLAGLGGWARRQKLRLQRGDES